ncbi:hypothetical protein [uncultured Duncaniella sp.]|jgi:hypothetical protein|uniref:hypothetical protein n=1 Tax=uncultured Duncaniella sp. TaxID=2768039 RepID=UPI0027121AB4|nr:hypothetical protein [uncultured Duncaniella sp.]
METERKILKVENAEQSLAFLLMAKNVKFAYSYGAFYIFDTHNPELFLSFCKKSEVRQSEIDKMVVTETTADEF